MTAFFQQLCANVHYLTFNCWLMHFGLPDFYKSPFFLTGAGFTQGTPYRDSNTLALGTNRK